MQIGNVSHVNLYFESIDKGEKRMKRRRGEWGGLYQFLLRDP